MYWNLLNQKHKTKLNLIDTPIVVTPSSEKSWLDFLIIS